MENRREFYNESLRYMERIRLMLGAWDLVLLDKYDMYFLVSLN